MLGKHKFEVGMRVRPSREGINAAAPLSKEEVAVAAGVSPTSSGLNAGLKELCSLALIQRLSDGSYELAAEIREAA